MMSKNPAYKEVWFWVVLSPLILVVLVCAVLLRFAIIGADDRVSDNYYKEGRMINNRFEAEQNAARLNLQGSVVFDEARSEVHASLTGDSLPETVQLTISHPATAALDKTLMLVRAGSIYKAPLKIHFSGHQYVLLENVDSQNPWRLSTEINFNTSHSVKLNAVALTQAMGDH